MKPFQSRQDRCDIVLVQRAEKLIAYVAANLAEGARSFGGGAKCPRDAKGLWAAQFKTRIGEHEFSLRLPGLMSAPERQHGSRASRHCVSGKT